MNQPRDTKIPAPLYAAAGAGDLAYEQLRKLPAVLTELTGKAVAGREELRGKAVNATAQFAGRALTTTEELRGKAAEVGQKGRAVATDLAVDRLREVATRNAAAVIAGAQAAQERALAAYTALVARGERVVGTGVVQAADTVNADMVATEAVVEATGAPVELTESVAEETVAADKPTPATVAEAVEATPVPKRPRAATATGTTKPAGDTPSAKLPKTTTKRTRTTSAE